MGAAASALNSPQSAELTKELKAKYEAYKDHGFSDAEIHEKLSQDYTTILSKVTAAAKPKGPTESIRQSGHGKVSLGLGSKRITPSEGSGKGKSAPKAPTRRRSFDANAANRKPAQTIPEGVAAVSPVLLTVTSEPVLPSPTVASAAAAEAAVDSWDSVTSQPYCNLCQMAFKSDAFLQRHVKYSDLHIQNMKKADMQPVLHPEMTPPVTPHAAAGAGVGGGAAGAKGGGAAAVAGSASAVDGTGAGAGAAGAGAGAIDGIAGAGSASDLTAPIGGKQVEGIHFKMLYTGSKFFWRTQDNIDLHFFHHILSHSIEIVSFDVVKSKELPRIYVDYVTLWDNARHHYHKSSADQRPLVDEEQKRTVLTTYLLQRLQLATPSPHTDQIGNRMTFVKLAGDENIASPVLDKMPPLIPVVVTRRRRTNAEEIDATISSLANDRLALIEATDNAEKIANLVYSSATQIASKKWWADFNKWRKLWIWAIRRVIRQKLVAETKKILAAHAARSKK